mmetsp:Transcript_2215/g.5923  ORF Transcript_2215/g.5923 Transcript_2215/m.5923 type:complete len:218 (-) Transcript_2215:261-914(-)
MRSICFSLLSFQDLQHFQKSRRVTTPTMIPITIRWNGLSRNFSASSMSWAKADVGESMVVGDGNAAVGAEAGEENTSSAVGAKTTGWGSAATGALASHPDSETGEEKSPPATGADAGASSSEKGSDISSEKGSDVCSSIGSSASTTAGSSLVSTAAESSSVSTTAGSSSVSTAAGSSSVSTTAGSSSVSTTTGSSSVSTTTGSSVDPSSSETGSSVA